MAHSDFSGQELDRTHFPWEVRIPRLGPRAGSDLGTNTTTKVDAPGPCPAHDFMALQGIATHLHNQSRLS